MNITQEKIDGGNALLKVKLEPQDYSKQYDDALKNYRRQLNLPGFRAGKVPMGMVKNRFGKSLLAEEINKVLNNSIQTYIKENEINVLGSPIPSDEHEESGDWDNPGEFEFVYELGLAPALNVAVGSKDKLNFHTIKVDDKMLSDHLFDVTARQGELNDEEESADGFILAGEVVELDESGEIKPGGIFSGLNFRISDLDADTTKTLTGLKVDDKVKIDPRKAVKDEGRLAEMLDIPVQSVAELHENFQFTVKEVKSIEPAELNKELFDKVYPGEEVTDEKEFKARLKADIANNFLRESDQLFKRDITRYMIDKFNPELPDSFLKKWIRMTNEKPVTAEEIERDYDDYKRGLQWQLIFNELVGNKEIEVTREEVTDKAKSMLAAQFAQYGIPTPSDEELESSAMRILAKEDQARGIYDSLYDEKLIAYIKENASVKEKEVSFDEFVEMANN